MNNKGSVKTIIQLVVLTIFTTILSIFIALIIIQKKSTLESPKAPTTPTDQVELDEPLVSDNPLEEQLETEQPSSESEEVVSIDSEIDNVENILDEW